MSTITPGVELYLGNTRWLNLRLRQYGKRGPFNVSNAQRIAIEFAKLGEVPLPPVYASRSAPGADWIAGRVPVLVSPANLTARVGTYDVAVTLYDSPREETVSIGRVEVLPRPIAGMWTLPNGNAYAATNVMAGVNASAYTIPMGAPVSVSALGLIPAHASTLYKPADGIAVADSSPGSMCLYIALGQVRMTDWSAVFGAPSLPVGANELWLGSNPATITAVEPMLPDPLFPSPDPVYALRQVVGDVGSDPQILHVGVTAGFVL